MTDDGLGFNGQLRRSWARTLRVALANEGISRIELNRRLVARFGQRAPSQTSTYRLVSGEQLPRVDQVVMIARVLDVSPRDLLPADSGGSLAGPGA